MSKFCAKGHQMEDSWETCPTCQTTGYQVPGGAGAGGAAAKTRLETDASKEAAGSPAAGAGRRTVLISEKRKASGRWLVRGDERRSKGRRLPICTMERIPLVPAPIRRSALKRFHRLQPARQRSL